MKDIVIIPTFDRPEYLWACLENIYLNVRGALTDKIYWICEDIHEDKPKGFTIEVEMLATIREWEKNFGTAFRYLATFPHTSYGNSYNVLSALHEAAKCDVGKVYLIEDDVLVTPDFFEWNDEVHRKFFCWVSCAGRLNRSLNFAMNGPEAIDESIKDVNRCHASTTAYNSWATCFSREALDAIAPMAVSALMFGPGHEQDILIQNFLRKQKHVSIWPYVPRAYHMGWYSYHRDGMRFNGTLEEKVKALQSAVTSKEKIRVMACIQEIDAFPTKHHEPATDLYLRP